MVVLMTYPMNYSFIRRHLKGPKRQGSHLCSYQPRATAQDIPIIIGYLLVDDHEVPLMSALWGGCLSFSKCHAERRAQNDKLMNWVFWGEEYLRSMQLWTRGHSIYFMVLFWFYQLKEKTMCLLVDTNIVAQFLAFSGIFNTVPKLNQNRCEQLHWAPYAIREIVQALLPGWTMHQVDGQAVAATASSAHATTATDAVALASKAVKQPMDIQRRAVHQTLNAWTHHQIKPPAPVALVWLALISVWMIYARRRTYRPLPRGSHDSVPQRATYSNWVNPANETHRSVETNTTNARRSEETVATDMAYLSCGCAHMSANVVLLLICYFCLLRP
ncbi:Aste57867_7152 [Aphanomyces stellatus]|uniref:Aste57867_7152 protein n=1 Tax=Aphanomyces stellatus TaxID=120398 RepID=A0A485KHL2_9STRA|nr:hypothetical protein As57867_007128 [Aphanomyces stellatus]VFT84084.1 Aste57867_7152 [Aphanomyces stellatus]